MDQETPQAEEPVAVNVPDEGGTLEVNKPPRTAGAVGFVLVVLSFIYWGALVLTAYFGATIRRPPAFLTGAVMLLPYLSGGYLVWVFSVWVVAPDRKSLPVALGLGALFVVVTWGPTWPAWTDQRDGEPLVVLEWNVERLWGEAVGEQTAVECVVQTVQEAAPDLISFLEVSQNELAVLSERLELTCVQADYLNSGKPKRGGLAVCVRGDRWSIRRGAPQPYLDNDSWTYVFAELESESVRANALAVHLRPYAFGTHSIQKSVLDFAAGNPGPLQMLQKAGVEVAQIQADHSAALLKRVERFQDPTVLAGDFNSTRDMALHYGLRDRLVDAFDTGGRGLGATVRMGGWLPLRVDFIYNTPNIGVVSSRVLSRDCSDHRPMVSELIVPTGSD